MADIKMKPVEVVVVGMGVAGAIIAQELAAAGMKVVGFERGRDIEARHDFAMPYAHDELRFENSRSDILQNLSKETLTFRNSMDQRALPMRQLGSFKMGEAVGGTALHWGGGAKRYLPWDFVTYSATVERYGKKKLPEDSTTQDWGITYDELEPYFDQFEYIYGVGGTAGNVNGEIRPGGNPFEGVRSRDYPNPASPIPYGGRLFAEAAKSMGYSPFPNPTCGSSTAYTNLYKVQMGECKRAGFCSSHGCAMDAKGSPVSTTMPALRKNANFELRALCNVIRINKDSTGKKATGVTYIDSRGREVEQPADIVVVAAYAFNNTRLMLLSGIGKQYDPVTNTGTVGKNYSYQVTSHLKLFFEDKWFNPFLGGAASGMTIDDWNGDNFDHSNLDFIGGAFIDSVNSGAPPAKNKAVPDGTPNWGSEWKRITAHYYNRNMGIGAHCGSLSYRTNYLDLDPTYKDAWGLPLLRMTFDWKENEIKLSRFMKDKAVEIAKLLNPSHINAHAKSGHYSIVPYQSTHNMGGCIMGDDPSTSALNRYLQSWDVHNVFVVGGSAFPQNSSNNPTSTIGALACWTADAIKDQYRRNPGSLV